MYEMPEKICVMCKQLYDTNSVSYEQRIIADEDFCAICWTREIVAFSDDITDFSHLEGLIK
jgi:hypothetical protein